MATISPNDHAPAEAVRYNFGTGEFELGGRRKKYETDDQAVIDNARTHPWLTVSFPVEDQPESAFVEQVTPADDPMSRLNDDSNDIAAEASAEEENVVAIEAGLDQTSVVKTGEIAQTLAADADSKTSKKVKN